MKFTRSFRFKLLLASLLVEGLMLALLVGNSLRLINEHLIRQTEARIAAIEMAYGTAVAIPLASRDYATLRDILDGWRQAEDILYLVVTDPAGKILASSGWDATIPMPMPSATSETASVRHVRATVSYLGQSYGTVQYGLNMSFLAAARHDLFVQGTLIALGEILLSMVLLSALGYWLTLRLVQLDAASERISHGDYGTPVRIHGQDEIAHLAHNFNLMGEAVSSRINALKETQAALMEAKQAAEQANVAKSRFLANMSHELRTPLNAVIGMAQILAMTELSDEQKDYVKAVHDGGHNLLAVINDILDVARLESGGIALCMASFVPSDILCDLERRFVGWVDSKSLTLTMEFEGDSPPVLGDATRIGQLLGNLLSNAIKFTEQGWVALRLHCRPAENNRLNLCFIVQDTGIGMASEVVDKLFSPFYQADSSVTRHHGGTGLGLALSKRLADLMGASLAVTSTPGDGSTFTLTLELPLAATI